MNQITTRYITENGACYEQYVITDPEAKTAPVSYTHLTLPTIRLV